MTISDDGFVNDMLALCDRRRWGKSVRRLCGHTTIMDGEHIGHGGGALAYEEKH